MALSEEQELQVLKLQMVLSYIGTYKGNFGAWRLESKNFANQTIDAVDEAFDSEFLRTLPGVETWDDVKIRLTAKSVAKNLDALLEKGKEIVKDNPNAKQKILDDAYKVKSLEYPEQQKLALTLSVLGYGHIDQKEELFDAAKKFIQENQTTQELQPSNKSTIKLTSLFQEKAIPDSIESSIHASLASNALDMGAKGKIIVLTAAFNEVAPNNELTPGTPGTVPPSGNNNSVLV
ncbi:MAG: hypothetical protein DHS20C02_16820 [Micavibrio sp.]|nr:MAG: hypothetical protein DHS20C02_16820 [Micavibrio sp.]